MAVRRRRDGGRALPARGEARAHPAAARAVDRRSAAVARAPRGGSRRWRCRSGRRSCSRWRSSPRSGRCSTAIAYQPLAEASVLVLLIVSVAVHFALTGLGLWFFGAEGSRTPPFSAASFAVGGITVSVQSLLVVGTSVALIVALYALLRPHAVRQGAARHRGQPRRRAAVSASRPDLAGALTFTLAALLCAFSGVLIGPITDRLLRLRLPGQPQGLRRRDHRRARRAIRSRRPARCSSA